MSDRKNTGSCLCGDVTIEIIGTPSCVAACHCQSCRKHTGAPVAVFVDYFLNQVNFTGAQPKLFESSNGVSRGFCENCGSTISYQADNLPDLIHMHIGVFDEPQQFTPSANENTESKFPWLSVSIVHVDDS